MPIRRKALRKMCSRCERMFLPTGKYNKICDKCRKDCKIKKKVRFRKISSMTKKEQVLFQIDKLNHFFECNLYNRVKPYSDITKATIDKKEIITTSKGLDNYLKKHFDELRKEVKKIYGEQEQSKDE